MKSKWFSWTPGSGKDESNEKAANPGLTKSPQPASVGFEAAKHVVPTNITDDLGPRLVQGHESQPGESDSPAMEVDHVTDPEIMEKASNHDPTKPPEPSFVGFVGGPPGNLSITADST